MRVLEELERDPAFIPAWDNPQFKDNPRRAQPGPYRRGRATYERWTEGEVVFGTRERGIIAEEDSWRTTRGQGLAGIWTVYFREGRPLCPRTDHNEEYTSSPFSCLSALAMFEVSYHWTDDNGAHCGDLTAWVLRTVDRYVQELPGRRVRWAWCAPDSGTAQTPQAACLLGDPTKPVLATVRTAVE